MTGLPGYAPSHEHELLRQTVRELAEAKIAPAAAEASVYERSLFKDRQSKAIEDLRAKGIQFAKMDEGAFLTTMKPVWQKIAATYKAEDLLEAIVKAGQ